MAERDQESLLKAVRHFILNLCVRDRKIRKAINEHVRAGVIPPHIEARLDNENIQSNWEWIESFSDGGLKVKINGKEFYARFQPNGNLDRLTPWDNHFPE